ncbi:creatininase [Anaerovorax odorimutans]|uniref:Creatininase n=1 Tax=Anaerovorax odorimutans TaxID=109327 RepID=A0ABT1RMA3_9FIRM|nr:creatininase [Anaerovorax odorimutans]MCQ4636302.1 creatininase [Anaerovorax odorimutans]
MSSVFMQEISWQEFKAKKEDAVIILPVGSTEQHGPMLPLSVDAIISTGLAKMIAEEIGGLVAPTVCYGYKSAPLSGGGPLFPGTLDLNGATLTALVSDILEELIRDGVKKIFVMNGHFENEAFILEAIDLLSRKYEDVTFIESSWWDQISDEVMDKVFDEVPFPGWALEHAAIAETSMTMYFRPDLVHMERFIEDGVDEELGYSIYPASKCKVPETGLLATARTSSKEKGKLLAEDITAHYAAILKDRM